MNPISFQAWHWFGHTPVLEDEDALGAAWAIEDGLRHLTEGPWQERMERLSQLPAVQEQNKLYWERFWARQRAEAPTE